MKFYYVYILKSKNRNFIYVGFTENLKLRLKQHNNKEEQSTKSYAPFELIHYEAYLNKKDAREAENYFKSGHGREVLRDKLKYYFGEVA